MQYEITDRAAIECTRAFYESLADGLPVDAALAEARAAIHIGVNNLLEWGTPVLYLRAPDGLLFDVAAKPTTSPAPPIVAPPPAPALAASPVTSPPAARSDPPPAPAVPQKTKEQYWEEGIAHRKAGRYTEALAAFDQAIKIDPNDELSHSQMGFALSEMKRPQEALAAYNRAIQLAPNYVYAYAGKGKVLCDLKRFEGR